MTSFMYETIGEILDEGKRLIFYVRNRKNTLRDIWNVCVKHNHGRSYEYYEIQRSYNFLNFLNNFSRLYPQKILRLYKTANFSIPISLEYKLLVKQEEECQYPLTLHSSKEELISNFSSFHDFRNVADTRKLDC